MGVRVEGMDDWLADLEKLPERAAKAFRQVTSRAGFNMKDDWHARWQGMPHEHIPRLVRLIGYDLSDDGVNFTVTVGVTDGRPQSRLASLIENGTLTSGPHPGGLPALEAEAPRMEAYAAKVAQDLIEGRI